MSVPGKDSKGGQGVRGVAAGKLGLAAALVILLGALESPAPPTVADAGKVAAIKAVVRSIDQEWSERFKATGDSYRPARVLVLRTPPGHPAHGAGYTPHVGVIIDLSDIDAIDRIFGDDAPTLNALLIAHEIGHHVQFLTRGGRAAVGPLTGRQGELQADCYAGWWLAAANARTRKAGEPERPIPDLEADMPRVLALLSAIQAGRLVGRSDPLSHGLASERSSAIKEGLAAETPDVCEGR